MLAYKEQQRDKRLMATVTGASFCHHWYGAYAACDTGKCGTDYISLLVSGAIQRNDEYNAYHAWVS